MNVDPSPHPAAISHDMRYRQDIDGLRAVAVLSVIFFHLNPAWASGGFVGVDLFFVISGFLITSQIRQELALNNFTLKNFYLRRIRRIAPPLIAMLMAVCVVAWCLLEPEDLRSFAYSLVVQPLSLQNLVFLSEGNYFRGSETKALLHTWSLAVEEQFYLFWPVLLVWLHRFSLKAWIGIACGLILASFYLSATLSLSEPQAAFFLIFTRTWELGLGGLAAVLRLHWGHTLRPSAWLRETLGWASMAALGYGIFFIDATMPFPGIIALVPVLGACVVVLLGGSSQSSLSKLLSRPSWVAIGLISYPLYLWHWPLLVFMQHLQLKPTEVMPFIGFWLAALALAYASFRWLELPIRRKRWLGSSTSLLKAVAGGFAVITAFALHVVTTDGAAYRFADQPRAFLTARIQSYTKRCEVLARLVDLRSPICHHHESPTHPEKVLLWGNSHASMLIPMLDQLAKDHQTSLYVNTKNTRPLLELDASNQEVFQKVMAKAQSLSITRVVLASSWQGLDNPLLEQQLVQTVADLTQHHMAVWLVVDSPGGQALDPMTAYAKDPQHPQVGSVSWAHYNQTSRQMELAVFQRLVEKFPNVHIIDTSGVLCDATQCWGGQGGQVWYRDATHLSNAGTQAIAAYFLPVFQP